ncbi:MAG: class I SAM-dependent rRNA methyltransferase [Anaerolineae bacterium]
MATVILNVDREHKVRNFYPWVYQHEVQAVEGEAAPGDVVQVKSARGQLLGRAFYNPSSHIPLRMLTLDPEEAIHRAFFEQRLAAAIARRQGRIGNTDAVRLVYAEADALPGLVVDSLAGHLVLQIRNHGMERARDEIVRALKRLLSPPGIYERSDMQAREEEGMAPYTGLLWGQVPERLEIFEDDIRFEVSIRAGQKTGFYMDQRDNRRLLRSLVKPGDRVLDVYSYTGGFGLHAARAGAQVLAVDKDGEALQLLEANARRNGLADRVGARWGDAIEVLGHLARENRRFTHIVLDPPTLAKHKNDVPRVKGLFTEMMTGALRALDPGGLVLLSTCAYHISPDDLIESARMAANDLHRRLEVLTITYQPADHPWIIQLPETLYLKTVVLKSD